MWFLNLFNSIQLINKNPRLQKYIIYTPHFVYYFNVCGFKKWKNFIYTSKHLFYKKINHILYETTIVSIRYIGKIYRLEKYKKKFKLLLHFPGKNYLIYKDIKIKWRRKKKRRFLLSILTSKNIKKNFFFNLLKLRIPNTYTKRGIYNNLFIYYSRKRKLSNNR